MTNRKTEGRCPVCNKRAYLVGELKEEKGGTRLISECGCEIPAEEWKARNERDEVRETA